MIHTIFNNHNLAIANKFINDNEPTFAIFTDPKEEMFNQPLKK